jgi:chromosome segregation ATPase
MAISWVQQGYIQVAGELTYNPDSFDGVKLESPRGLAWLESISSFRFEPAGDGKPYTVRKEASGYWYGYRKVSGKLHKKYVGKSSEISTAKLEEIAEALNAPPQPRVTDKVTQVTQISDSLVTDKVTDTRNADRLTALELQVQALQESLEALREELRGKLELGDSVELPKVDNDVDNEVAEELQNELSNLKAENEKLKQELVDARTDYTKLLESSTAVKASREKEIAELRSQLEAEKARYKELDEEFRELDEQWSDCKKEIRQLEAELSELKQKSVAVRELPEAADVLNQLKSKRKKSKTDLADVETLLEILALDTD